MNLKAKLLLIFCLTILVLPAYKFSKKYFYKNRFDIAKTSVDDTGLVTQGGDQEDKEEVITPAQETQEQEDAKEAEEILGQQEAGKDEQEQMELPKEETAEQEGQDEKNESSDKNKIEKEFEEIKKAVESDSQIKGLKKLLLDFFQLVAKEAYLNKNIEEISLKNLVGYFLSPEKADILEPNKSKLDKYFDDIKIKNPVITKIDDGLRIKGLIDFNKIVKDYKESINKGVSIESEKKEGLERKGTAKIYIEIHKDDKVYGLMYIRSPKSWEPKDYFPGLSGKDEKVKTSSKDTEENEENKLKDEDIFEFGRSYFYISTNEISRHKKLGKVIKGAGFKALVEISKKSDFLGGILNIKGPMTLYGKIDPKIIGSEFKMKLPSGKIFYDQGQKDGQQDETVPGFAVKFTDGKLKIKIVEKAFPEIKIYGGIKVKLPSGISQDKKGGQEEDEFKEEESKDQKSGQQNQKKKVLKFFGSLNIANKKVYFKGRQSKDIDLFGIEDFYLNNSKISIKWDFSTKNILPKSLKISGAVGVGKEKSKLSMALKILRTDDKKLETKITASGSLYLKDFIKFWIDVVLKNQKSQDKKSQDEILKEAELIDSIMKSVPDFKFEDISLNALWAPEDKQFKLKINKADINLGQVIKSILALQDKKTLEQEKKVEPEEKNKIEEFFSKFNINKAVIDYYKGGLRIRSNVAVNKKILKLNFEVAKNNDNKWYSLFYLESPDKWKLEDFFPELSSKIDFTKVISGYSNEKDILGFERSYFYISTANIPDFQKSIVVKSDKQEGKIEESSEKEEKQAKEKINIPIVKGIGFSGKAKLIGPLGDLSAMFGLEVKPVEVSGNINLQKFSNSDFSIKIPSTRILVPKSIKIDGLEINPIPGAAVELMEHKLTIGLGAGVPEIKIQGGIKATISGQSDPIEFTSLINFEDKKINIVGTQKGSIPALFGIKDLTAKDCKIVISYDAKSKSVLPDVKVNGKIGSGKSNLDFNLGAKLRDKNKLDGQIELKGALYVKDFANFWLDVMQAADKRKEVEIKKEQKEKILALIPDLIFKDILIDASWGDIALEKHGKALYLELKVDKPDINFDQVMRMFMPNETKKGLIESSLAKFGLGKISAESSSDGITINSSILINNKPLNVGFEVSKDQKVGLYSLLYLESPEKFKLTDYFPNFFMFKMLLASEVKDSGLLKLLSEPDIFEFGKSYFYISSAKIEKHKKFGDVDKGIYFNGQAKPIGLFKVFNDLLQLKDKPIKVTGKIEIPDFVGSKFSLNIPTQANIFPEKIISNGKELPIIPGFKIDLAPAEFSVVITSGIPKIQSSGAIEMSIPGIKEKLLFSSELKFNGQAFSISGGQKNELKDIFGVKGLDIKGSKIGLNWDFGVSSAIATPIAAGTAGIGSALIVMPVGFILEGGIRSGESNLSFKNDFALSSSKAIKLDFGANGTLMLKDFMEFWMNVLVKDPKITDKQKKDFMEKVPDFKFEDVKIDAVWTDDKENKFEVGAKKIELVPGTKASVNLKISKDGIVGSGSMDPLLLPDKDKPVFKLLKIGSDKEGPSFSIDAKISPFKIDFKSDARVQFDLGQKFGKIDSSAKVEFSPETGIDIDSKTSLFGTSASVKIGGKLGKKIDIDSWFINADFDKFDNKEVKEAVQVASVMFKSVSQSLVEEKKTKIKNMTSQAQQKSIDEIEAKKKKVKGKIDSFFSDASNLCDFGERLLNADIEFWKAECGKKPGYEKPWCDLFQVISRQVAAYALKIFRTVGADLMSIASKKIVDYKANVDIFFKSLSSDDIKKNFDLLATSLLQELTDTASEMFKSVDKASEGITINSLKFDTKIADIKAGKLPLIGYDVVIMGDKLKGEFQYELKSDTNFIKSTADLILGNVTSNLIKTVQSYDTKAKEKIDKKSEEIINEAQKAEKSAEPEQQSKDNK